METTTENKIVQTKADKARSILDDCITAIESGRALVSILYTLIDSGDFDRFSERIQLGYLYAVEHYLETVQKDLELIDF